MNNAIENKVNTSLESKDNISHKPHLSESILKIKEKISKKKESYNVHEEKFKKHIDAYASKKDVSFTNKSIFGTNFSPNKENIYCALGFLIVNLLINNDGSIKSKKTISKANLWSYIYYLRLNNKSHPYFLQNLGEGNKVSPLKFYSMIASNKKSVTKKNLVDFIQLFLNSGYKVNIPFLHEDKHVVSLVNTYHNNIIKNSIVKNNTVVKNNNTVKNNTDDTVNIKIIPSVKLVGNSNINANSKNSNIIVTLDIGKNSNTVLKNSNNSLKNSSNRNTNNSNIQRNAYKKNQTTNTY